MPTPQRFNIGDIIEKIITNDPYEDRRLVELHKKYGMLTYLILDVENNYIKSIDMYHVVYKVMCLQNDDVEYRSLRERNGWKKVG